MQYDKEQATKLRLQGKSYSEIKKLLGIPKSTLSGWLKNLVISNAVKAKILSRGREVSTQALLKRNKLQTHLAQQKARGIKLKAIKEISSLTKRELKLIGTALYWAEGYKRPIIRAGKIKTFHPVSLSNSDPLLVKIFLRFLREICEVPENKISAGVRIYQHHNADQLLQFWHENTKIPISKFEKFYYGISKSSQGKRPFNILPYGTIQIRVGNTELYHKIMGWIEGLSKI